jgi:hypothetical protein
VWVVDHLSDDIAIVDVAAGNVVKTLRVGDEPTDVVFAKTRRAETRRGPRSVCLAAENRVKAFDPLTLALLGTIPLFSDGPQALALSPDTTQGLRRRVPVGQSHHGRPLPGRAEQRRPAGAGARHARRPAAPPRRWR